MTDLSIEDVIAELKNRGVQAGEAAAEQLRAAAQAQAQRILSEAKGEAAAIVRRAESEAKAQREQLDAELRQAAATGLIAFRQSLEHALLIPELSSQLSRALEDEDLLAEAIVAAAGSVEHRPLDVLLPHASAHRLSDTFMNTLRQRLSEGVTVRFEHGPQGGFQLAPRGQGYLLDFTDQAFLEVFLAFLAPRFRSLFQRPPTE